MLTYLKMKFKLQILCGGGSNMYNNEIVTEKLVINKNWCKGCGICVNFCPRKVLILENEKVEIVDIDKCIECGQCELRCPDYAIYLRGKKNEK